jgi:hypothetical protein
MGSRIHLLFSSTILGFLLSGCVFGNNQQFFENAVNAVASIASPPVAVASASVTPTPIPLPTPNSDICKTNPTAAACDETPIVTTPGVVTILFTMQQIPQSSGTLILANAIKYASPVGNPKILFAKDSATNGEDEGDPDYIKNTLLAGYSVQYVQIPVGGLDPATTIGYDLVIVSNPGYPLSDAQTLSSLLSFKGGVILIGDDMSQGDGFNTSALTGLTFRNNGTGMSCNGTYYNYDNEGGYQYQIAMNPEFLPGVPAQYLNYQYGNDLDWTTAMDGTQVLAWGTSAPGTCDVGILPAVARHPK